FELARIPGERGTLLRTRKGFFRTREVHRDDNRLRGVQVREPLVWRWIGMADTTVITTGLSIWSTGQPASVLPRGPIGVARRVTKRILGMDPNPVTAKLERHSIKALTRRLWWASASAAVITGVLAWVSANGAIAATWV